MSKPKLSGLMKAALAHAANKDNNDPAYGPTGRTDFVLDDMAAKHNAQDGTCNCLDAACRALRSN